MIKVIKTTEKNIKKFTDSEWPIANLEIYGRKHNWKTAEYVYKAIEDDKIVGILTAEYEEGVFYIGDLLVAHNKRGQGIGKILMKKAEKLAKKHNSHKMTLETGKGWPAESFYKSLGFKKEADLKNHWLKMDFSIYSKNL